MSLYLCIFDNDEEIEGVDVGAYSDFDFFRKAVTDSLECGLTGSQFPTLNLHSDCDGEWSVADCVDLENELGFIATAFIQLPPVPFNSVWQYCKAIGTQS
jgi:hypothetical protein